MIFSFIILVILFILYYRSRLQCLITLVCLFPTLQLFTIGGLSVISFIVYFSLLHLTVYKSNVLKRNKFPLMFSFTICVFSYLLSYVMGKEKHPVVLINAITFYILPYLLWKLYEPTKPNVRFFNKCLIIYLLASSIYGLYEAISGNNVFANTLNDFGVVYSAVEDSYRRYGFFRARAFTIWCSIFGTICGIGLTFLLIQAFKGYIKFSKSIYLLFFLLMLGVIISGTRSVIFMTLILLCSVFPYVKKNIGRIFVPLFIIFLAIIIFDNNIFSSVVDSLINPSSVEGSSVEMREYQYTAALYFFNQSPIVGNGLAYISKAIEFDSDLFGGESIVFSVLIDRGVLGAITLGILYGQIFYILLKRRLYFLCFIPLGFVVAKVLSLIPGLDETYILLFLIPLIKQYELNKYGYKNNYLP